MGAHSVLRSERLPHHLLNHRIFRLKMFAIKPVVLIAAWYRLAVCPPKYIKLREVSIAVPPVSTLFSMMFASTSRTSLHQLKGERHCIRNTKRDDGRSY